MDALLPVAAMLLSQPEQYNGLIEMLNDAVLQVGDDWLPLGVLVNFEIGLLGIEEVVYLFVVDLQI